ncbi:hypothetical protein JK358_37345 [Nocardia sp. 2]|uniref:DUF8175 domain-containing protein n=1 Tax=Nocardia acididurans TaxID=2802282 RepID=A0ABS1MLA9_9NOCA|nr:hypothetical protein [Nocardia acididurans]
MLMLTVACGGHNEPATATVDAAPDPQRAPAELRWEPYQGVELPVSSVDGPAKIAAAATGYSHTPQGAALAAIQHSTRLSLAPDGSWAAVAAASVVSGPGKDAWVLARARISITGPATAALVPTLLGYRITSYQPERVAVTVYARYPDDSLAAFHQTVAWVGGDWRLDLSAPSESNTAPVEAISVIPADLVTLEAHS